MNNGGHSGRQNRAQDDWEGAYRQLCQRRHHASANADVWDLRFRWPEEKTRWFSTVIAGEYRLSPMQVFHRHVRHWVQWSAHYALVLKWGRGTDSGPVAATYAMKGHGGMTGAIKQVSSAYHGGEWCYVYRTDIRGYYRHIIKTQVGDLLQHVDGYFASREEMFYARYMDDFIIFTPILWSLRQVVKRLHSYFAGKGVRPT